MVQLNKRRVGEAAFVAMSFNPLVRLRGWRGVVTLAYHRIHAGGDPAFDPGVLSASEADFSDQLAFIDRHFEVVSPDAIKGEPMARGRRVLITFDDGYRDNHEFALPVLRERGLPATFFLTTGFLDDPRLPWWDELAWMLKRSRVDRLPAGEWLERPVPIRDAERDAIAELTTRYKALPSERGEEFLDFCGEATGAGRAGRAVADGLWMTWEMAAELRDAGMTIGGHTVTHPVLARAPGLDQRREIAECARRLDEQLGVTMRFFAYPVGLRSAFNEETKQLLREARVELAFSLYGGYLRPGRLDPFDVPRASVGIDVTAQGFRAMLAAPSLFARW